MQREWLFQSLLEALPSQVSASTARNLSVPIAFVCLLHLANEKVRHWLISLYFHHLWSFAPGQWEGEALRDTSVFPSPFVFCTWLTRRWDIDWYLCIPIIFQLLRLASEKVRHCVRGTSVFPSPLFAFCTLPMRRWGIAWYLCIPITFICLLHLANVKVRHCVIPLYSHHLWLYLPSAPGQCEGEALCDTSVFPSPVFCTWPMRR